MDLNQIKSDVNLVEFARRYGIDCNPQGKANCPFHEDDRVPSFEIRRYNGQWTFKDWHDNSTGSIVDLMARMENITEKEAIKKLLQEFGSDKKKTKLEIERFHIYKDQEGRPIHRKVKYKQNDLGLTWAFQHKAKSGTWKTKKGDHELIPYNLDRFKNFDTCIVCEGEADGDRVNSLGFKLIATSAPVGKGSWPKSLTKYFKGFKKVAFCYDTGAEDDVKKHAGILKKEFPDLNIFILTVPLKEKNADISDYLNKAMDEKAAFNEIMEKAEKFELEEDTPKDDGVMSIEELAIAQIAEIDWLVNPIVGRRLFTLVGGIKGIGKSLFVTQLALFTASGETPFISDEITIPNSRKILLIQQEVSLPGMKDRLLKMRMEKVFNLEGRFLQKTTAGHWLSITEEDDFKEIQKIVEKYRPDIIILDPLFSFTPRGLNRDQDAAPLLEALFTLKDRYDLGLIVVHHFSNKENPDDPRHMSGRFMGASNIANAADVLISLDFLHPRYKQQALPLAFNHYANVEITTRHGEWPARFTIERDQGCLLFNHSSIWKDLGRIIVPGQISDIIALNDGEILQRDLINQLKGSASSSTIKNAIDEAVHDKKIEKIKLPGRGGPVVLRLKESP